MPVWHQVMEWEWGSDLISSWNKHGWFTMASRIGDKIARIVGAKAHEVMVADSTSVNLFKVVSAALQLRPRRRIILSGMVTGSSKHHPSHAEIHFEGMAFNSSQVLSFMVMYLRVPGERTTAEAAHSPLGRGLPSELYSCLYQCVGFVATEPCGNPLISHVAQAPSKYMREEDHKSLAKCAWQRTLYPPFMPDSDHAECL